MPTINEIRNLIPTRDREIMQRALACEELSDETVKLYHKAQKLCHRCGLSGQLPETVIIVAMMFSPDFFEPKEPENPWLKVAPGTWVEVGDAFGAYRATFQECLTGRYEGQVLIYPDDDPGRAKRESYRNIGLVQGPPPVAEAATDVETVEAEEGEEEAEETAEDPQWLGAWDSVDRGATVLYAPPGEPLVEAKFYSKPSGKHEGKLYITLPDSGKAYTVVDAADVRLYLEYAEPAVAE